MKPPIAAKRPLTVTRHGLERTDDYAWLRADNWQEVMRNPAVLAPDIRAYLEAENAYFAAGTADEADLREKLFREMRGRIKEDDSSVPSPDGPYTYAVRTIEGGQHPLYARAPRDGGAEEIMLDGNALAEGKAYFKIGGAAHSPDHRLLAWSYDDAGSEFHTISIRDLASGTDSAELIPDTTGAAVWTEDCAHVFYTRLDENHRSSRTFRHRLGTPGSEDVLVYDEPDQGFFTGVGETQSKRFVVIDSHDHETSEIRLIPADAPGAEPILVAVRETGVEYEIDEAHGTLYILTNAGGAKDFKIVTAPAERPGRENWTDLVPHEPGRLILSHSVTARHLVRLERFEGLPRIVIRRLADGAEHVIAFDEEAYSLSLQGGYEFDTDSLRFAYSSMTTPSRVYDYDMETRERVLRKEQEVPSGHDPEAYETRRVMAPAPDGELVPVSLLYRKDTPLDGTAPCLLYGYGSYGITIPASFSVTRLSLVDRGFVYAIAHIRGGKDKGYSWYEDGKREKKPNTFTDFIAAGEHLVGEGFTSRGRIVAEGGSAGGMLMGAVANMAPDLFSGIIAVVPFVDVLNTMLDDTLPLTPPEWPEWGNPIAREKDYRTILAYSPYDNVSAQDYPAMLVMAGLTDPRVTYWEPAKWVARLRATRTDDKLLLLRTNMDAGHAGAAGRFDALKETAIELAFALRVSGRTQA
ncbi:oligopeptidase B Serine peptidase. MEROPS family S09A [Faunimonas pinastri]|uniref:Oligopeptidase B Serine peptidase. MEROPS family S09A n=1 Tax=Faunimonas pinastri TaxID=1855383 RepID=A0A1H9MBY0_9HYPH|nr:S9 family peptidase [Faunimonas pinastri]SER20653.1 oligopeptidase B Serine peptidase. MEROPS family S09A [Faunimonas pinastri]